MDECLFCKIAAREISADIVYENDQVMAFRDIDPKAPSHIVFIPKKHMETIMDVGQDDKEWWSKLPEAVQKIARQEKMDGSGFRMVLNCREDGGQTVGHLHFHLLGRRKMTWPPG